MITIALRCFICTSFLLNYAYAEDWKTTDGKTYANVTVVKVEDDAVTILDEDGGARVPLANLPADLQMRFNYDPEKAKEAALKYDQERLAAAVAIEKEKAEKRMTDSTGTLASQPVHNAGTGDQSQSSDPQLIALNQKIDALLMQSRSINMTRMPMGTSPKEQVVIDNENQALELIDKVNELFPKPVEAFDPNKKYPYDYDLSLTQQDINHLCDSVHLLQQIKASNTIAVVGGENNYKLNQADGDSREWGDCICMALDLLRKPSTQSQNQWLHKFIQCGRLAGQHDSQDSYHQLVQELLDESGYNPPAPSNRPVPQ